MITNVTFSIVMEGNAETISAAIASLLAQVENPNIVVSNNVPAQLEIGKPKPKTRKPRRPMTDEEKEALKKRLAEGRAKKAAEREAAKKAQEP